MSSAGRDRIPKRIGRCRVVAALALVLLVPSVGVRRELACAVHGSVNQVYVTGAQPGTSLRLVTQGQDGFQASRSVASAGSSSAGRGRQGLPGPRRRRLAVGARRRDERPVRAEGPVDLQPDAARRRLRLPDHPRRDQPRDRRAAARARPRTAPTRR